MKPCVNVKQTNALWNGITVLGHGDSTSVAEKIILHLVNVRYSVIMLLLLFGQVMPFAHVYYVPIRIPLYYTTFVSKVEVRKLGYILYV